MRLPDRRLSKGLLSLVVCSLLGTGLAWAQRRSPEEAARQFLAEAPGRVLAGLSARRAPEAYFRTSKVRHLQQLEATSRLIGSDHQALRALGKIVSGRRLPRDLLVAALCNPLVAPRLPELLAPLAEVSRVPGSTTVLRRLASTNDEAMLRGASLEIIVGAGLRQQARQRRGGGKLVGLGVDLAGQECDGVLAEKGRPRIAAIHALGRLDGNRLDLLARSETDELIARLDLIRNGTGCRPNAMIVVGVPAGQSLPRHNWQNDADRLGAHLRVLVAEEGGTLREIFSRGPRRTPWGSLGHQHGQE
jgi:ABC-type amino acid transport substrate-binding protein